MQTQKTRMQRAEEISREVIGAAIEVHRILGPGLLESIYEKCFIRELDLRGLRCTRQCEVRIEFKDQTFVETLRFDVMVEDVILCELKAVQGVIPIHKATLLSYMKLLDTPLGFVMNFHELRMIDGISRMILRNLRRE